MATLAATAYLQPEQEQELTPPPPQPVWLLHHHHHMQQPQGEFQLQLNEQTHQARHDQQDHEELIRHEQQTLLTHQATYQDDGRSESSTSTMTNNADAQVGATSVVRHPRLNSFSRESSEPASIKNKNNDPDGSSVATQGVSAIILGANDLAARESNAASATPADHFGASLVSRRELVNEPSCVHPGQQASSVTAGPEETITGTQTQFGGGPVFEAEYVKVATLGAHAEHVIRASSPGLMEQMETSPGRSTLEYPAVEAPAAKRQKIDADGTSFASAEPVVDGDITLHHKSPDSPGAAPGSVSNNKKIHHNEQWNEMLMCLAKYKEEFGNCLVPKRYAREPKLGTWVETQRVQYKRLNRYWNEELQTYVVEPNKRLTAERLQKLQDLGFCWSAKHVRKVGGRQGTSENAFLGFQDNSSANDVHMSTVTIPTGASLPAPPNGHMVPLEMNHLVPIAPMTANNSNNFTMTGASNSSAVPNGAKPRPKQKGNTKATLQTDAVWEEMYSRLVAFKEQHGHCLVPRKYELDPMLATWVEAQRALWNRDLNKVPGEKSAIPTNLTDSMEETKAPVSTTPVAFNNMDPISKAILVERKQRLDQLGFVWSLRSKRIDDHWDEMFQQLLAYKAEHGDCLVPSRYEANLKLGKWVETQRYEYTKLKRAVVPGQEEGAALSAPTVMETSDIKKDAGSSTVTGPTMGGTQPTSARLTPERLRRLESIGFEWRVKNKMKRYYDKQWDAMFQRLLEFRQEYGHVNVPKRFPEDQKLGTWVHTQRIQFRKLTTGENGGENGRTSPTQSAGATEEGILPFRLTEKRRQRLEEVGFCWSAREGEKSAAAELSEGGGAGPFYHRITRNSYDDQWDVMFALLEEYKRQHGDCLVPKRYAPNPKLGTWVDTQRVQYKKLQKKVAEMQHQKRSIPPGGIVDYSDESGDLAESPKYVPTSESSANPSPLVGRLTQDRIRRLQDLGFVWSLRDDWAKHYEELKVFKQIHGHCNVPARHVENRRLGIWVSAQRQQYKILQQQKQKGAGENTVYADVGDNAQNAMAYDNAKARRSAPLTQERIDLLNAIGFTWIIRSRDSLGESWNERLQDLRVFKHRYGHCLVPSRYEPNPELGIWVGTQRTQYRLYMQAKETGVAVSTSMNEERIATLEELGFVWALRGSVQDDNIVAATANPVELPDSAAVARLPIEPSLEESSEMSTTASSTSAPVKEFVAAI